jgi:2,3-bisphosphoglycerate-independent phosphoglycerate mutase
MKFLVVVPDGMADDPRDELGGKTPVEAAEAPNLNRIAREGRVGQVKLIPAGLPPGSDVANLALLGYNPAQYYTGRAPIEAASMGITLGPADWAVRCNLVTVSDGVMVDYSAGHVSSQEAAVVMNLLNEKLGGENVLFHPGVSYRNLLVLRNRGPLEVKTTPPHDILGKPVERHLPAGKDAGALLDLMNAASPMLAEHEVNKVRLELGENPANAIWLWGEGQALSLPSFQEKYGKTAALISAVDLLKGLAVCMKMDVVNVPGATGYYDTDYAAKGKYACEALRTHDLVFVHVEAPDEAGHDGDTRKKVQAIESIDKHILGPALEFLEKRREPFRVLVLPDHATPIAARTHTDVPVPFAMFGGGVHAARKAEFSEAAAAKSDLKVDPGHELMGYFLGLPEGDTGTIEVTKTKRRKKA